MKYFTTVRKRRRGVRVEWTARLIYKDQNTGKRKERSKSARSRWEAMLLEGELRAEFKVGGQAMVESRDMTFAQLARHFQETEECNAWYDVEGRKLRALIDSDAYDEQFMRFNEFFGKMRVRDIRFGHLRVYRNERHRSEKEGNVVLNAATVNREMCALRAVLNAVVAKNWIPENSFDLMRRGELIMSGYEKPPEERFAIEELWVH
ncbi:MAG TPA: hypothetical protein VJ023_14040 [Pyrinomonadaceae bacterium]|nr:hypothetical protein [Pyrinomonadaceae bacterium]